MISYPSMQQYFPTYNQANQTNFNQSFQPNYNNYNTSIYQPNYNTNIYPQTNINNVNNTNIYNNNFNSPSFMAPQSTIFQGQSINFGGGSPMIMQGQSINIGNMQPVVMQAPPRQSAPQQDNSSAFMQQLVLMLLSTLLTEPGPGPVKQTTVDKTRVWGDPHYEVTGKDGNLIKFDHKGNVGDTYNVFKGDGYEVEGTYVNSGNNLPIIGTTRIQAGADVIQYDRSGKTSLNGKLLKDGSYDLNDGTKLKIENGKSTIESRDGDSKIDLTAPGGAITVTPTGDFSELDGIIGTAISKNRALTEEESNKFDLTTKKKKAA